MKNKKGFTLIELLTVIAIMGILATLGMGGYKVVMPRVRAMQSKVQFQDYIQAMQKFKAEYGYYPFVKNGEDYQFSLNGMVSTEDFVKTLSGKNPRTGKNVKFGGNYKALTFYEFKDSEFEKEGAKRIVDAFGNPNIWIVVDTDDNGLIKKNKLPGVERDVRAKIVIYTKTEGNSDWVQVKTWED